LRLSLRAPEGCVAISSEKARLLRFTRNDNSYSWLWVYDKIKLLMKIYLDVCCLNRLFDGQVQDRVRLELK